MNKQANGLSQTSLFLRLLGGGYLVYLAWDLRGAVQESLFFLIAMVIFGLVGVVLFVNSLVTLIRRGEFFTTAAPEIETTEDCEERSDD